MAVAGWFGGTGVPARVEQLLRPRDDAEAGEEHDQPQPSPRMPEIHREQEIDHDPRDDMKKYQYRRQHDDVGYVFLWGHRFSQFFLFSRAFFLINRFCQFF
jgi:hypothetical protein